MMNYASADKTYQVIIPQFDILNEGDNSKDSFS